ncbi:hypothetical protein GJ744_002751 [Endocarpon pusillum]|uniref:Amidohydrolase-related domain-containing protein n=1 Tax=Endocarpon pusillum TaxID=364733 RepID=A0A8H7E8E2_9EURO|nr:hypothetical protein GJ744_002751 [Endocarpon pusillum]
MSTQQAPPMIPHPSATTAGSIPTLCCFTNCQLCLAGELIAQDLYFSPETGCITPNYYYRTEGVERIDLGGAVVAPGFLDLQINGAAGVHFTELGLRRGRMAGDRVGELLATIARREVEAGVTGWWATVPTVERGRWSEILALLAPRAFANGASLLGAHAEGPYLHPSKKGAHNSSYFLDFDPSSSSSSNSNSPESIYNLPSTTPTLKLVTLAPELPGSLQLISHLQAQHPSITISLGHSTAAYQTGLSALHAGARALTHVFNAMPPLHQREPGLAGLMGQAAPHRPYYSVIADGVHLHPSVLRMALRTDPARCMLITDSVELAGLPDGIYPGNGQIRGRQRKLGGRVTLVGEQQQQQQQQQVENEAGEAQAQAEEETLIGSCCSVEQCVRNMVAMADCTLAEAVRCVTENVAGLMAESKRGVLEAGRRADLVVLDLHDDEDDDAAAGGGSRFTVRETWVAGRRVYNRRDRDRDGGESRKDLGEGVDEGERKREDVTGR